MDHGRVARRRSRRAACVVALGAGFVLGLPGVSTVVGGLVGDMVGSAQAAIGGGGSGNTTFTTSTTHHTTNTRVDVADAQAYQTRVIAFDVTTNVFVFDQTVAAAPGSPAVNAAFAQAQAALVAAGAPTISGPVLIAHSTSRLAAVHVGDQTVGTNTTITTATTVGPTTILIGTDQSVSFSVAAGTQNVNQNTHFETFVNNLFQATTTNSATYELSGTASKRRCEATAEECEEREERGEEPPPRPPPPRCSWDCHERGHERGHEALSRTW